MSQTMSLVTQYEATSQLSEGLGCALLDVKRYQLALPGANKITTIQLDSSRQTLDNIVAALEARALNKPLPDGFPVEITEQLFAWVSTLSRGQLHDPEFLTHMHRRVSQLPTTLKEADFTFLEQLLLICEAHANHILHRIPATEAQADG